MKVTVVIPTYYKNEYKYALESVIKQKHDDFEVIVVRNGAERNSVLKKGKLTVYEIIKPGLDNARNFGIKHAKGEIVAFIDDDALASSNWIKMLVKSHKQIKAPVIGGKVLPKWPNDKKPIWINGILLAYLSILDYSDKPVPVHPLDWLAGANISFKKYIFDKVGYFDEELDRKERILLSSGEVDLCNKIREKGYEIFFDPSLVVKHVIPEFRLTPQYMVDRAYWQGISDFVLDKKHLDPKILPKKFKELNSEIQYIELNPKRAYESVDTLCRWARAIGYLQSYMKNFLL